MSALDILKRLLAGAQAVVFDFDNVIADSEPFHYRAYAEVFGRRGHTIDREEYWLEWTSRGGGAESEIRRYRLDMDPVEIRAAKDPIYSRFCRSGEIRLFPEAVAVIESLGRLGLALAIASGSYEADIRAILAGNGIEDRFAVIVGKDRISRYKPHPETYLEAASRLGIPPGRCLAVEDAEKGIRSARGAGMPVILVETEITKALGLAGADLAVAGLAELAALLDAIER